MFIVIAAFVILLPVLIFAPNRKKETRIQKQVLSVDEKRTAPLLKALYGKEFAEALLATIVAALVMWYSITYMCDKVKEKERREGIPKEVKVRGQL